MAPTAISFGGYVTAADVRNAVQKTIEYWSDTYLAEMSRHDGQSPLTASGTFPSFASYPDALDMSRFPEEQLPACVLVVPGLTSAPQMRGTGKFTAEFTIGLGIAVTGPDKSRTIQLAQLYTTAVRMLILQNSSLGDFAMGVHWTREEFTGNIIHPDDARTIAMRILEFIVQVDDVVDVSQGPSIPIPNGETPTGWATIETPSISITSVPVGETP